MNPEREKKQPTHEQLLELVDPKNPILLRERYGGVQGLATLLGSSPTKGLDNDPQVLQRQRELFGTNELPEAESTSFLGFVLLALGDKTLIVLMVAAAFEIAIGIYKAFFNEEKDTLGLIDGAAILVAVIIVVLMGAISDYRKQAQFRALSDYGKSLNLLKVIRGGAPLELNSSEVLIGDLVTIQTGVVLPADGVLVSGHDISCDESSMTGEPFAIEKDAAKDPFLLSGTNVVNGVGNMIVIGTGTNSLNGRSMAALQVEQEDTPLQQKLNLLADAIAKFAFYLAAFMIVVLAAFYFAFPPPGGRSNAVDIVEDLLLLVILAVTVVVVAVPEGLPLAVTLSLAQATMQMLKDNNLVRNLSACETMGNATTICSDKTGTLTLNKMSVVESMLVGRKLDRTKQNEMLADMDGRLQKVMALVARSVNVNSTAEEVETKDGVVLNGSKTEIALLGFLAGVGFPYQQDRASTTVPNIKPFSSERKRASCIVEIDADPELDAALGVQARTGDKAQFLCVKGAAEIVLRCCNKTLDDSGRIQELSVSKRQELEGMISDYADEALRTICCAILPLDESCTGLDDEGNIIDDSNLVFCGIFGIMDPLRPEVAAAVAKCQKAGVVVRMVTGDSTATARAIARGCGILAADGVVMEGPAFRKLSEQELNAVLPKLQVLARSSPLDKQILVRNLKRLGETVAVTGDGTNDAPALAQSDGIAGTEVAKEASDIILLDDNFASLVKAVVWGRCVFDAIRKFLQFQLTVNVSAVAVTVVTALYTTVTGERKPVGALTAIQLLWVNLIMDTLAALAFATDKPSDALLNRKPSRRTDPIISPAMFNQIVGQAIYQIVVCLVTYFAGPYWFKNSTEGLTKIPPGGFDTATIVFNTFIFCQLFNEINCRSITKNQNVFEGFFANPIFHLVLGFSIVCQIIIVMFGGEVFNLNPKGLGWEGWLISLALGSGTLVAGYLIRFLPDFNIPRWLLAGGAKEPATTPAAAEVTPSPVVIEVKESQGNLLEPKPEEQPNRRASSPIARDRWNRAITATRTQVAVTKNFRTYVRSLRREGDRRTSVTLNDPRAVKAARTAVALQRMSKESIN
ncbi:Calcium-transporting ATPase 10, plasma membrane-type [Kappamyces sp. JEL0680]|nr:Calcium-transporting ATPase 10, plasma membrane-type [Kappamyces sp. JEL0680]